MEKETMRFYAGDVFYKVEKKKDKYFQIYKCKDGIKEPLTHRESFKSACKVAKLLADTYSEGMNQVRIMESQYMAGVLREGLTK
ncbi:MULTISPECIES: hypothetical protein [Bacillus]|uniref:hypothetical protein n=1 Tax=Bacillus TaxID=1386 RepID=UPI000B0C88AC|nr:hypothetical protein [Bacillus cereus]